VVLGSFGKIELRAVLLVDHEYVEWIRWEYDELFADALVLA